MVNVRFLILFMFLTGFAQAQVSYHNFNVNDGLPSNEVYCVHQDRQGYIWFGTDHGVARYDGHEFKSFTTENGLTDNTVFLIKEDDEGKIWFLTFAGGICYFDGKTFRPHPQNDTIIAICKRSLPTSWAITAEQTLWLGFAAKNVCKISETETRIFEFGNKPFTYDSADYVVINFKNRQFIYTSAGKNSHPVVTDADVESIRVATLPLNLLKGFPNNFNLVKRPQGGLILSQWNEFLAIDSAGNKNELQFPKGRNITRTKSLDGKNTWILIQNGPSYLVNTGENALTAIDSFVLTNTATDIITDRQGNDWISTLNAGVFLVANEHIKIFDFSHQGIDNRAYSVKKIGDDLYAGLSQNSYFKINQNFTSSFYQGAKSPSPVSGFLSDGNGHVNTDVNLSSKFNYVYIIKDATAIDNNNFLGGETEGFIIFDHSFKTVFDSHSVNFAQRVNRIAKIADSKFILGTNTGLFYFEPGKNYKITEERLFKNTRITACKTFNNNIYALATRGKGVFLSIKNKFYAINTAHGLKTNLNEDIYFENDSVLWVASYKGIARVYFSMVDDSLHLKVKCYMKEDGLCSDQVNAITGFNGYIWVATNEGLCYFKAADLPEDVCHIPVYLGNVFINGVKRSADSLDLKYDQNNLLIEFQGLYFKATSGINYKVRLKGKEAWKFTSQSYVQYFNLPPGNYELQVAAEDKFGKYNSAVLSLKFVIHPKFTDTVFFRLMMLAIALGIIAYIVFLLFRYQRLKSMNFIHLLKAEFKALNYQINPHFIFNVLNSIQYYILRKESDKAVHFLNSFSILIRRIVTNSRQQYISVLEEVECLKEYMDLEKLRLEDNFDYEINIDSAIDIEAKILLPMVIQPMVENSIWHGIVPSGNKGKVKVDFKQEGNTLVVVVEDNGVGLNKSGQDRDGSPQHLSMAMSNVKERLKIIGDLNNSTWYINMDDKKELKLTESGTVVTIRFPEIKKTE